MSTVYPAGPADVPGNLTEPSSSYRRHAWLAVAGLLLFALVYFALASWFGWTAWRLFSDIANGRSNNTLHSAIAAACSAFLAVFMFKALVFVKHGEAAEDIEVTAAEQPALFDFLNRLAAETGAPRPHRVYLSGRVNAAVFYDLSIANLLLPSRKNLEIGLGLVNVLTLGELKAVLAHEFGHFAQKSMAVGRWVYIAQQIAGHSVARRDALDTFLTRLSGFDLRVAWIGWLLRLVVWSIRSLVDLLFRAVIIAQRALSREMEFQADLVAVSVTGSDALIHALHKLGAADDAWDKALAFAGAELQEGRGVKDLFAVQLRVIENVRSLLGDPSYGTAPPLPAAEPEAHRVFKVALAAPPRMWATHPANADREANAKRRYVRAAIDDRSAWTLFNHPQALRERVSAHMAPRTDFTPVPEDVSLAKLQEQYARGFFNSQYRGAYLGRSVVRHAQMVGELYGVTPAPDRLVDELDALYPPSLSREIERLRNLEDERHALIGLREGFLTAPGGVIRHRGTQMSRKALPAAIEAVEREVDACAQIVRDHDRRCRATHLAAAKALGEDWAKYLKGLLELLHYADHVEANLLDAHGLLSHTVDVATADGQVSSSELSSIVYTADTAHAALKDVHDAAEQVIPDRTVLKRMRAESWSALLGKLELPPPHQENIGDWLNAVSSWIRSASSSLAALRLAALEQLLAAETQIAAFTRKGLKPAGAPPASVVPSSYRLLTPGSERPRRAKLTWWDRFQTASGTFPTLARLATAAAIIGAVLVVASSVGTSM
jgi:Zn-dependent protease with chaperone function